MKTEHREIIKVNSGPTGRIVVQVDSEAGAAYVRLREGKVARTVVQKKDGPIVTADIDRDGNVIGLEFIGVEDFTISSLFANLPEKHHVKIANSKVQYIASKAGLQSA